MSKNFYEILGVTENASFDDIKKSYRKLAKTHHPDKNMGDQSAADKFKKINEAYSVLSDEYKRASYDDSLRGYSDGSSPFANFAGGSAFADIFGDMFGGFGSPRESRKRSQKSKNRTIRLDLPLDEMTQGDIAKRFRIRSTKSCIACSGKGGDIVNTCHECNGMGKITHSYSMGSTLYQNLAGCTLCKGRGKLISGICGVCHGEGVRQVEEIYEVLIKCKKI